MFSSTSWLLSGAAAAVVILAPQALSAQSSCPEFLRDCQTMNWQFSGASQDVNTTAVYSGDPASVRPGSTHAAATWTDVDGNLWIFGGSGYTGSQYGYLNDLWTYNLGLGTWTWARGSQAVNTAGTYSGSVFSVTPGARSVAQSWTDAAGNFWLFGGEGYDSTGNWGYLSDMWKYEIASGNWTFVHGSTTRFQRAAYTGDPAALTPGARAAAVTWVSGSDLYLFGGYHANGNIGSGDKNDLWKFETANNRWVCIQGDDTAYGQGTYSGDPATLLPAARRLSTFARDANGNTWMFGGMTSNGFLNDLWKYDASTGYWSLLRGTNATGGTGIYTGTPAGLTPGSRHGASAYVNAEGQFVLFGGRATVTGNELGYLDDLWTFDPKTGNWTCRKGDETSARLPVYTGDAAALTPGARYNCAAWPAADGSLWLFGGQQEKNEFRRYADLWKLDPDDCGIVPMHIETIIDTPVLFTPPIYDPSGAGSVGVDVYPGNGSTEERVGDNYTIRYTPDPGYVGTDSFVIVTGGNGCPVSVQTVAVTVHPRADLNGDGLVNSMDYDTDFDGFSDPIENTWGTSPYEKAATPTGAEDLGFLGWSPRKASIPGKAPKPGKPEKISLDGFLPLAPDTTLAGQRVAVNLAGNTMLFTLDTKGKGSANGWTLQVKLPKVKAGVPPGPAQFKLKAAGFLYDNLVVNSPLGTNGRPSRLTLDILINNRQHTGTQPILYKK